MADRLKEKKDNKSKRIPIPVVTPDRRRSIDEQQREQQHQQRRRPTEEEEAK